MQRLLLVIGLLLWLVVGGVHAQLYMISTGVNVWFGDCTTACTAAAPCRPQFLFATTMSNGPCNLVFAAGNYGGWTMSYTGTGVVNMSTTGDFQLSASWSISVPNLNLNSFTSSSLSGLTITSTNLGIVSSSLTATSLTLAATNVAISSSSISFAAASALTLTGVSTFSMTSSSTMTQTGTTDASIAFSSPSTALVISVTDSKILSASSTITFNPSSAAASAPTLNALRAYFRNVRFSNFVTHNLVNSVHESNRALSQYVPSTTKTFAATFSSGTIVNGSATVALFGSAHGSITLSSVTWTLPVGLAGQSTLLTTANTQNLWIEASTITMTSANSFVWLDATAASASSINVTVLTSTIASSVAQTNSFFRLAAGTQIAYLYTNDLTLSFPATGSVWALPQNVQFRSSSSIAQFTLTPTAGSNFLGQPIVLSGTWWSATGTLSLQTTFAYLLSGFTNSQGTATVSAIAACTVVYAANSPTTGLSLGALSIARFGLLWPSTSVPTASTIYPLSKSSAAIPYYDYLGTNEYSVTTGYASGIANFQFAAVTCPTGCDPSHLVSSTCTSRTRCICSASWSGTLCDCNLSQLPSGATCSSSGGPNWVYTGSLTVGAGSSVTMPANHSLTVSGGMTTTGAVTLQGPANTLTVGGTLQINNPASTPFTINAKLYESHVGGVCTVLSDASVTANAVVIPNGAVVNLVIDTSGLSTDGSCVTSGGSSAAGIIRSLGISTIGTTSTWNIQLTGVSANTNFQLPLLSSGNTAGSSGASTQITITGATSSPCAPVVSATPGTMTLTVGNCPPVTPPPVLAPISPPPTTPPVAPVAPPVTPVAPPVAPVAPPVAPISPPSPPVAPPVTPIAPPVTPPVAPVAPPVAPVAPPVTPVAPPVSLPVAAPVAEPVTEPSGGSSPTEEPTSSGTPPTESPTTGGGTNPPSDTPTTEESPSSGGGSPPTTSGTPNDGSEPQVTSPTSSGQSPDTSGQNPEEISPSSTSTPNNGGSSPPSSTPPSSGGNPPSTSSPSTSSPSPTSPPSSGGNQPGTTNPSTGAPGSGQPSTSSPSNNQPGSGSPSTTSPDSSAPSTGTGPEGSTAPSSDSSSLKSASALLVAVSTLFLLM